MALERNQVAEDLVFNLGSYFNRSIAWGLQPSDVVQVRYFFIDGCLFKPLLFHPDMLRFPAFYFVQMLHLVDICLETWEFIFKRFNDSDSSFNTIREKFLLCFLSWVLPIFLNDVFDEIQQDETQMKKKVDQINDNCRITYVDFLERSQVSWLKTAP